MKAVVAMILLLLPGMTMAQGVTPAAWGLREISITDRELGRIRCYVTVDGIDVEKPLLFVSQASGGLPTVILVQSGGKSIQLATVHPDLIRAFSGQYHVAYIGKAGTPFCDTVTVEQINPMEILEGYRPSAEYTRNCSMEWHVRASAIALDTLCATLPVRDGRVIALGASEGGRLLTRLAHENRRITHLACLVSGGLNELYSPILNMRIDEAAGRIGHQEAQAGVDSLFAVYAELYADPGKTEKIWYGHPYRRWASFGGYIPLEQLVQLDIPILFLNASADRSTPVLQSDYVRLEFLRLGRTNLTYRVLPGCDHQLYEVVLEGGQEKPVSHRKEAFQIVADWIEAN